MIWTTKQIEAALSVKLSPSAGYGKIQFNSKHVEKGDLFIALPGARDGHEFVVEALKNGASAAIISKDIINAPQDKLIKVKNTSEALTLLADYKRNISKAKIIAVTGSVGKTSTKESLRIMLSAYGKVHASHGTFNNSLGVSLTLASMPDDTDYAIIEMGMNAKGELRDLSKQVLPDIALITTVSEGHLEFFGSVNEIADAKCEIFNGLDISTGIAIINRDMDVYAHCEKNADYTRLCNIQTFGKHEDSDTRFVSYEVLDDQSTRLVYEIESEHIEILMDYILPIHLAENFAAAFSVVKALELYLEPAASAIPSFQVVLGRGRLEAFNNNGKNYRIICDYYNSSPQSLRASLEHFSSFNDADKIVVLGDMGELGAAQSTLHKAMVPYIIDSGATKLFLVGDAMGQLKEDFPSNISARLYSCVDELIAEIDQYIQGGELILIKGSRSLKLDKLAKHLGVLNVL